MRMAEVRKSSGPSGPRSVVYQLHGARTPVAAAARGDDQDSAGVTEAARELNYADRVASEAPEVRADRVRALKEQIASGNYRPDPKEVAREILKRGL